MINKNPKPFYRRLLGTTLKTAIVIEAVAFAVSYTVYYRLNTNRDFRLYMFKNHNWVLEGYYGLGEKIGGYTTRDTDLSVWSNEGKI